MISLIMLLIKENKELENKQITGNLNSMTLKDNTLIFKVNLKKKRLYGRVNLNSLKSKKIKLKKIKRRVLNSSKLQSINSRKLITIVNQRMSKITEWLCNSLSKNSKKKRKSKRNNIPTKMSNFKRLSRDQKKKTKL